MLQEYTYMIHWTKYLIHYYPKKYTMIFMCKYSNEIMRRIKASAFKCFTIKKMSRLNNFLKKFLISREIPVSVLEVLFQWMQNILLNNLLYGKHFVVITKFLVLKIN